MSKVTLFNKAFYCRSRKFLERERVRQRERERREREEERELPRLPWSRWM